MRTSRLDLLLTLWFMALITLLVVKVIIPSANSILASPPPPPPCYASNPPPVNHAFYILPISSTPKEPHIYYD